MFTIKVFDKDNSAWHIVATAPDQDRAFAAFDAAVAAYHTKQVCCTRPDGSECATFAPAPTDVQS